MLTRLVMLLLLLAVPLDAKLAALDDWDDLVAATEHKPGLVDIRVNEAEAKVYFELPGSGDNNILGRYVYAAGVTGGLGSNPLGIDRSTGLTSHLLVFRRAGNRVYAEYENTGFRATGSDAESLAVSNSFARSVVWSGEIAASRDGKILVDMTSFLVRDAGNLAGRITASNQGTFSVDSKLSWLDTGQAHAFPTNLEFDAYLTFTSKKPGGEFRATTPEPGKATLIIHSTFMQLPDDGYVTRDWDERAGLIGVNHVDMSTPLGEGVVRRLARRWRLEKINPGPAPSPVTKPVVYYVDNSVPEPIRGALLDGARWWEDAFEAAGFIGAYKVEVLPEGVHPLDARYNVINWVHRATRGWSYGWGVADPRTGEMMKGFVLLGSLRVRQDIKIFEGLAGTEKTGSGDADDPVQVALARIRQLSAHEVGHTLGFAHNMGASSYMGRASVMDYPAPDVRIGEDGELDFTEAYAVGMGEWDFWSTKYLYAQFDDENTGLAALIDEANERGLRYVSDGDSRPVGSGHLHGALWDNGEDPVQALKDTMAVRQHALERFGERNIRNGDSRWDLQTKFVPVYLYHRYQLLAAAKALGGMEYEYSRKGDGRPAPGLVGYETSVAALDGMLDTLSPAALEIPVETLLLLSPRGESSGDQQFRRESFNGATGPAFDHMAAVRAASDLTLSMILDPARMNRMAQFGDTEQDVLGADETIDRITRKLFPRNNRLDNPLQAVVVERYLSALIRLHSNKTSSVAVRSSVRSELRKLWSRLASGRGDVSQELLETVRNYLENKALPAIPEVGKSTSVPPGSPIGAAQDCWHCDTVELMGTATSEQ